MAGSPPDGGASRPRRALRRFGAPVLIAAAVLLAFHGTLRNGFVNWDDQYYVYENPYLQIAHPADLLHFFLSAHYWSYIPLTMLSHVLDRALWGLEPWGHHLTSLVLHAVNALLMFLAARGLVGGTSARPGEAEELPAVAGAAVAALLFALHPLRVESVALVADRKDLLCGLFVFSAFLAYLRSARSAAAARRRWYAAALLLHLCAVLSKATAVVVPGLLLVADLLLLGRGEGRRHLLPLLREKVPFGIVSLAALVVGLAVVPPDRINFLASTLSVAQRVLLPLHTLVVPLGKLLWPAQLSPVYSYPSLLPMILSNAIVVLLTAGAVVAARLRHPAVLAAWLAYVVMSVPTAAFFVSGIQPVADRYTYLTTPPFFVLAGAGVAATVRAVRGARARAAVLALPALLAVLLGWLSAQQVRIWHDSWTLWLHAVKVAPDAALVQSNLGVSMFNAGNTDDAIVAYSIATQLAPHLAQAHANLGAARLVKGELREGVASLEQARELFERYGAEDTVRAELSWKIGEAQRELGLTAEAEVNLRRAVQLHPRLAGAYYALGVLAEERGDSATAMRALEQAALLGDADARRALAARGRGVP